MVDDEEEDVVAIVEVKPIVLVVGLVVKVEVVEDFGAYLERILVVEEFVDVEVAVVTGEVTEVGDDVAATGEDVVGAEVVVVRGEVTVVVGKVVRVEAVGVELTVVTNELDGVEVGLVKDVPSLELTVEDDRLEAKGANTDDDDIGEEPPLPFPPADEISPLPLLLPPLAVLPS